MLGAPVPLASPISIYDIHPVSLSDAKVTLTEGFGSSAEITIAKPYHLQDIMASSAPPTVTTPDEPQSDSGKLKTFLGILRRFVAFLKPLRCELFEGLRWPRCCQQRRWTLGIYTRYNISSALPMLTAPLQVHWRFRSRFCEVFSTLTAA